MTPAIPNAAPPRGCPLPGGAEPGPGGVLLPAPVQPGAAAGGVHRVLRNSTFNLVAQGLYATCYLVAVMVLARVLGKQELGRYFTLFALILVIQLIAEAGISTVCTCRIAQAPGRWRETAREAAGLFTLIAAASLGIFLVLGAAWAAVRGEAGLLPVFVAAGAACAGIQVQRFCTGFLRAFEWFGYENLAKILQGVVFVALVAVLVGLGWADLSGAVLALALSHAAAAALLVGCVGRHWGWLGWQLSWPVLRDWLAQAVPLGLGDVVRGMTWQLDTLLLGALQPASVVGIYSVAYRPLGPLNWIPRAVLTAALPSFARLASGDRASLDRAFAGSIRLLWILSLPLTVGICICAEPLVLFLGGPDFREAAVPLRILIWVTSLSFLSMQFRYLFAAVGKQQTFARLVILVFVLEAVLEGALIPFWGYFGACTGSLVGEFCFTAAGLALCRPRGAGRLEWGAMGRAALAGAILALPLWFARTLPLPLLVAAAAAATAGYFALCVLLGALSADEVGRFYQALAGGLRPSARRLRAGEPVAGSP